MPAKIGKNREALSCLVPRSERDRHVHAAARACFELHPEAVHSSDMVAAYVVSRLCLDDLWYIDELNTQISYSKFIVLVTDVWQLMIWELY